ncbi:hypothetical protein [Paenibacillus silvae]|uniref:Uncharacterized protein n=1 Tax=Paenibacillus silvae TaxID=1325358 RepID=A0A2W6QJL0_9BACL|nr:hypothetical protein [Paenibacillus silvae]PZT57343.1 hypothetical protein DN757_01415 [Paenibacillus silvae]
MIYALIGIACLGLWIYYLIEECADFLEGIVIGSLTLVATVLIAGLLCMASLGLATLFAKTSYVKTYQTEVISLQDKSSYSGKFFLGSGNINGSSQYTFITKNDNEMKVQQLGVNEASLIYSDEPKIERYEKFFDSKIIKLLFGKQPFHSPTFKIYIPEGTIKENYNVDLQ